VSAVHTGAMEVIADPPRGWHRLEPVLEVALLASLGATASWGVRAEIAGASWPMPPPAGGLALTVAATVALIWRRRFPRSVAATVTALAVSYHLIGYAGYAIALTLFLTCYAVTAAGRSALALLDAAAVIVIGTGALLLPPHPIDPLGPEVLGSVVVMVALAATGVATRQRRQVTEERIRRADERAQAQLRQRLVEDRLRVARDLHDILAHTLAVITLESGVALDVLDDDPRRARQSMLTLRSSARQAMSELRATLGVLRDGEPEDTAPQPTLARLDELTRPALAAGLQVDLHRSDLPELPQVVQLVAYRIVQEGVTNAIRHAGGTRIDIRLRCGPEGLVVDVEDDGRGIPGPRPGGGFGLVGMRERAESLGGTLHTEPLPSGGSRLRAVLPLPLGTP